MRFRLSPALAVAFFATTVWLVFETRSTAEIAGRNEIDARAARNAMAASQAELQQQTERLEQSKTDVKRLEGELAQATLQREAMARVVEERTAQEAARVAAAAETEKLALAPIPEGVRLCLAHLHECLHAEGYTNQRFLSARALDAEGLHDVEMLDTVADGFAVDFVRAKRMVAELDRGKGRLVLRFYDGTRTQGGQPADLGKDGWSLVFAPIDARMFEERLPFLMHPEGVYPEASTEQGPLATDLDPITRLQWLDRFDRLLAGAGTAEELHVNRCRGLENGFFLSVQLLGTDSKHILLSSADCKRMAVEVDDRAGVVSLLLRDGVLRSGGKESTITDVGYRMLLPRVTPKQAMDVMLGMVVTR